MKSPTHSKILTIQRVTASGVTAWVTLRGQQRPHSVQRVTEATTYSLVLELAGGQLMHIDPEDILSVRYEGEAK